MQKYSIEFAQHNEIKEVGEGKDFAYVDALMLYEGEFVDAHGQHVKVTPAIIKAIDKYYYEFLNSDHPAKRAIRKVFGKEPRANYKNVVLNHAKTDADKIVGKIISLEVREVDNLTYLFGNLKILGRENVEKVEDGRWTEMSVSFDYDLGDNSAELKEVSYVFQGAINNVMTFSKNQALTNNKFSVELEKCRSDLATLYTRKGQLEAQIRSVEMKQKTGYQFSRLVEDGLISKADQKRLMIDLEFIDSSPHEVIVRAISTVAKSRKALRGRFNSNFSANAFESFVDNVITPTVRGEKMTDKTTIDVDQAAKSVVDALKSKKTVAEFAASEKEKIKKDSEKVEKHEEDKHTIRFKHEDMKRFRDLAAASGSKELCDFLKEMGCHEDKVEAEYSKEVSEKKDHDYSKLQAQMVELQAALTTTNDTIHKLTNKIVDLSKGAPSSTDSDSDPEKEKDSEDDKTETGEK